MKPVRRAKKKALAPEPARIVLKRKTRDLFRSMDHVSDKFLNKKGVSEKQVRIFYKIYQQLGLAWELLALQCKHWDGFRKTREGKPVCRICGTIKGVEERFCLMPRNGRTRIKQEGIRYRLLSVLTPTRFKYRDE